MLVVSQKQAALPRQARAFRFGQINFVNCLPVVVPMRKMDIGGTVQFGTPSELNSAFEQGRLDVGAMSSYYFLRNADLKLVPDISISSDGAVGSVICYSKVPLSELNGAPVGVPVSSATSTNLLRVLLKEVFGVTPRIVPSAAPDIENEDLAAALVIGDQALKVEAPWAKRFVRADLGEWWRINCGLPMVFGLWGARRSWAEANPSDFQSICQILKQSALSGLGPMFDEVVSEGSAKTGLGAERMVQYFKGDLNYTMTKRHLAGLRQYGQLCAKHGLFDESMD